MSSISTHKAARRPVHEPARPPARRRTHTDSQPWYRQFWPWFLILLPATSVAFSFATLYIALDGADEVVPHEGDSTSYSAPESVPPETGEAPPAAGQGRSPSP